MTEKPQAEKPVLAFDGKQWVRAMWVPKHSKEQWMENDDGWHDYNEADDTFYWPEGWYELQTHGGDEMLWHLTDGATAWQELPPHPTTEPASAQGEKP